MSLKQFSMYDLTFTIPMPSVTQHRFVYRNSDVESY